ncbi:unnamed protein product [Ceutorhynchus assimilis]|uniref:Uncharacterized protein n=1 Tax=Ceutorhynchus assimilis TaxID=467358 RepID=A0A9N9MNL6_9CUCU|nr:unnamed protein product [Ceutorhynchus assimilis]
MDMNTKNANTALDKHMKDSDHCFAFNNTTILYEDKNFHKLMIKEIIEIRKEKNAVNDIMGLNLQQPHFNQSMKNSLSTNPNKANFNLV